MRKIAEVMRKVAEVMNFFKCIFPKCVYPKILESRIHPQFQIYIRLMQLWVPRYFGDRTYTRQEEEDDRMTRGG